MNDNLKSTSAIMKEFDRVLNGSVLFGVGSKILIDRRQFEAVKVEPYKRRRDGADSLLVTWRGHCAACGAPYDVKGSRHASHLPKNCEQHRGRRTRHSKNRHQRPIGAPRATLQLECENSRPVRVAVIADGERVAVVSLESIAACAVNLIQAGVAAGTRAGKK